MTTDIPKYFLSEMTRTWCRPGGEPRLSMDEITGRRIFGDWPAMANHIAQDLRYPHQQASKHEAFGWTATLFSPSEKAIRCADGRVWSRPGTWRNGEHEIDASAVFYGDVDNERAEAGLVTLDAVAARLAQHGLAHLLYTTYSHSASHPKFRVVVPLSGLALRRELRLAYLYLNNAVFGGQADRSIYDPSDFVFGPCREGCIVTGGERPLDIADAADFVAAEDLALDPAMQAWIDGKNEDADPPFVQTPEQAEAIARRMGAWTVKAGLSIGNPAVVHPHWLGDYGAPGRSHNDDIGSILAKIWKRSGGSLTLGELAELYDQVDALDGSYCARKYGEARKLDRLRRIMRGITPEPVKTRSDLCQTPTQAQQKEEKAAERLSRLRAKNDFFN